MTCGSRLLVLAGAIALAASSATAWAGTAVLYPLEGVDIEAAELATIQTMVVKTIQATARSGALVPASPFVTKPTCGPKVQAACLKTLARGNGLVLVGSVKKVGDAATVDLTVNDSSGNVVGKTRFVLDLVFLDYSPASKAISALDKRLSQSAAAEPGAAPRPGDAPVAASPGTPGQAKPDSAQVPPEATAPAEDVEAKAPPAGAWRGTAGPVLTAAGGALLLGGLIVSVMDRQLSNSLDQKANDGSLNPADSASYSRVKAYNITADALFAAGAVAAGVGIVFWVTAPSTSTGSREVRAGISGRF